MDALGSAIRVDARGPAVLRVLPRLNDAVNEEWISDKTRYACDGLSRQRLDRPMIREGARLRSASWGEAFAAVVERLRGAAPERVGVIAGDLQDAESMKAALDLFGALGVTSLDCRQDGLVLGAGPRETWLFNSTLEGIEQADAILLVGTNPRLEAPVFNARLRKLWLAGKATIGLIGERADLTYGYEHLGAGAAAVSSLSKGDTAFAKAFKDAKRPAIIVGQGALTRPDSAAVLAAVAALGAAIGVVREAWNGWNVLHTAAARVGGLDLGFIPRAGGKSAREMTATGALDVLFPLRLDELDCMATDAFVVYLGTHGDAGRTAPTSSCRAPPTRRRAALLSTPEGGCSAASARSSPRARPARTGPSCAPLPSAWACASAMTRWTSCAIGCSPTTRPLAASTSRRARSRRRSIWRPLGVAPARCHQRLRHAG